jgi:hypothetical protein
MIYTVLISVKIASGDPAIHITVQVQYLLSTENFSYREPREREVASRAVVAYR